VPFSTFAIAHASRHEYKQTTIRMRATKGCLGIHHSVHSENQASLAKDGALFWGLFF
jgi:hypothetical protein